MNGLGLSASIAWRYLWRRKSHAALNAVAAVSVAGVAVAAAAMVCVLSVFNGFRAMLTERSDYVLPDIEVVSADGKAITSGDSLSGVIRKVPGVGEATCMVADQALVIYEGREMPVLLRGVDMERYRRITGIDSLVVAGNPGDVLASVGIASGLDLNGPEEELFLFVPRRHGRINMANLAAGFVTDSVSMRGIFASKQSEYDENTLFVPRDVASRVLQYGEGVSSIAVGVKEGADTGNVRRAIAEIAGEGYTVLDKEMMQAVSFRMVQIEKFVTGLLLVFILIIASFNIVSTMTMFVLEKERSVRVLRALGMSRGGIGLVFGWESLYITLLGAMSGILAGLGLCFVQEKWGIVKLYSDSVELSATPYPVEVLWGDVPMVLVPVLVIGIFTSWVSWGFARRRASETRR